MTGPRELGRRRLMEALRVSKANLAGAARLLGVGRQVVWARVQRDQELQKLCEEILEEAKDDWESKLQDMAMNKDSVVALLASLNAKARDRGYARHTTDVSLIGDVRHHHLHLHKSGGQFRDLSDAELEARIAARRAQLALEGRASEAPRLHPLAIQGEATVVETGGEPDPETSGNSKRR